MGSPFDPTALVARRSQRICHVPQWNHVNTGNSATSITLLFTDIEGSTRLWEQEPQRMPHALARHDAFARAAVEGHRGTVVKTIGDGVHAASGDGWGADR